MAKFGRGRCRGWATSIMLDGTRLARRDLPCLCRVFLDTALGSRARLQQNGPMPASAARRQEEGGDDQKRKTKRCRLQTQGISSARRCQEGKVTHQSHSETLLPPGKGLGNRPPCYAARINPPRTCAGQQFTTRRQREQSSSSRKRRERAGASLQARQSVKTRSRRRPGALALATLALCACVAAGRACGGKR